MVVGANDFIELSLYSIEIFASYLVGDEYSWMSSVTTARGPAPSSHRLNIRSLEIVRQPFWDPLEPRFLPTNRARVHAPHSHGRREPLPGLRHGMPPADREHL